MYSFSPELMFVNILIFCIPLVGLRSEALGSKQNGMH